LGGVGAMAGETTIDLVGSSVFDEIMVADINIAKAERMDVFFFNTPSLHYSKAETFKKFLQPLNCLFIGYSSVN